MTTITCARHGVSFTSAEAYLAHLEADHDGRTKKLTQWLSTGRTLLSKPATLEVSHA